MNKFHANTLTGRLEEVVDRGVAHILWGELYRWYGAERIAIGTWRDLSERWTEVIGAEDADDNEEYGPLRKIEGAGGIFLIAQRQAKPLL